MTLWCLRGSDGGAAMLATLLLAPAWAASPNFYWNVASANNSEIEANISASVSTIRFGQVRSPHPTPRARPWAEPAR